MTDSADVTSVSSEATLLSELQKLQAENEALRRQLADGEAASDGRRWQRRWLSITCAVLAAILLPVAVLTVWARDTVLDSDQYVATVAPLAEDEDIQEAISFRVTEAVSEAADFRAIAEDALPEDAQVLAAPIEAGAERLIAEVVGAIVATSEFATLWEDTNRVAHENLVPLLKGESGDLVDTANGQVVLKLGSVAQEAVASLDERLGTDLASQIPVEDLDAEFVLVDSSELADSQTVVRWFDNLSWFSVILVLILFVGVVVFAEQRRPGVRRLGLAVAVPMVLALLAYAGARDQYLSGLSDEVHNPDAAAAIFDILTRYVLRAFRALLVLGVLVMLGAWVTGPSTSATKVRVWWDTLLGRAGEAGADRDPGPIPRWVAVHERAMLIAAGALGALVLVTWTHPTGIVVLLIFVVTLLAMGGLNLVAAVSRRADTQPGAVTDEPAIDVRQSEHAGTVTEPDAVEETTASGRD
jgi:hypothetical protein